MSLLFKLILDDPKAECGLVARLSDFGYCASDQNLRDAQGYSDGWAAPECLERNVRVDKQSDIFSFGQVAMLVAHDGSWRPCKENETVIELVNRTLEPLELQISSCRQDMHALVKWVWLLNHTVIENPSCRLKLHGLASVRKVLLDVYG